MQNCDYTAHNTTPDIPISLAYAPSADSQFYLETNVPFGTTMLQALIITGWLNKFPEIKDWCHHVGISELALDSLSHQDRQLSLPTPQTAKQLTKTWMVGIFSQKKPLDYVLQPYDRIEVYRDLSSDPMNKRKKRARTVGKSI